MSCIVTSCKRLRTLQRYDVLHVLIYIYAAWPSGLRRCFRIARYRVRIPAGNLFWQLQTQKRRAPLASVCSIATGRPKPCEGNLVEETVGKPSDGLYLLLQCCSLVTHVSRWYQCCSCVKGTSNCSLVSCLHYNSVTGHSTSWNPRTSKSTGESIIIYIYYIFHAIMYGVFLTRARIFNVTRTTQEFHSLLRVL